MLFGPIIVKNLEIGQKRLRSFGFFYTKKETNTKLHRLIRECISTGVAGAQTRRSLGHHLLHPLIQIPNAFPEFSCTELVLLSYCELGDARISASDKNLPVFKKFDVRN